MLTKLIALPSSGIIAGVTAATVATWKALLATVPELPVINSTYVPCDNCYENGTAHRGVNHTRNVENPELYAVHPYRLATVAHGDADALAKAEAAFRVMRFQGDNGWNQVAMDAALLGNAAAAQSYVIARANTKPAAGYRFPVFAPHEQDYEPSSDHFSVFSNALQYMLIQRVDGVGGDDGDDVLLLPAWPCEWDVEFKVHAPHNAVVTGSLENGTLTYSVEPSERKAHVRAAKCQPPATPMDCKLFGCTCQGFADYFGAIAGRGWGCSPISAGPAWWSTHQCNAKISSGKYCDGPACTLPGHAPCNPKEEA